MFSATSLGSRIREHREKLGLKQIDVAHALQVSAQAVSKWERDENAPDISILIPLAKLLSISTDRLLGYYEMKEDALEATVLFADIAGTSQKAQSMEPKHIITWLNGLFFQLTEVVLQYDGIPVQYSGDDLVCFFSGEEHPQRAIHACVGIRKIVSDPVHMGLHRGMIHPCALGHPDYSSPSIIVGPTTILAFRTKEWAGSHTESGIDATHAVVEGMGDTDQIGTKQTVDFKGIDEKVEVCEIRC